MTTCIAVDPADLLARAARLRTLSDRVAPASRSADALAHELAGIGSPVTAAAGADFSRSWALALHILAGRLALVGDRLDSAAVTYATYEQLLAEAFD